MTNVSPGVVARWHSASAAVLRTLDSRWAWVLFDSGEPYFQSAAACVATGADRDDFSWVPSSWSWLERAHVNSLVPEYEPDGRLLRVGSLTMVFLGERKHRCEASTHIPDPVPGKVDARQLGEVMLAAVNTSWLIVSFDVAGAMDRVGQRPATALVVDSDDESWVPDSWRFGSHNISELIEGKDGESRLVSGELVQHELGTLAVFQVYQTGRLTPWTWTSPWSDVAAHDNPEPLRATGDPGAEIGDA